MSFRIYYFGGEQMKTIYGYKLLVKAPNNERITALVNYRDQMYVATEAAIYELINLELGGAALHRVEVEEGDVDRK